uniref:transient receptor potential cation channel subfamily M member 2-like isoform X2 n=1 Tax=Doryrhamphus excisus TaxID=161450 RepID=UPI0025ADA1E4|nr:transient receptor potential cation channel subfamily M member 2-like isoform X2 [Doryrhamphus excisus]
MAETGGSQLIQNLTLSASGAIKVLSLSPSFQHAAWIRHNIRKKECCFFKKGAREDVCMCGYRKSQHAAEAIKEEDFDGEVWDAHRHVREVPTDAFGDISFGGLRQMTTKLPFILSMPECPQRPVPRSSTSY